MSESLSAQGYERLFDEVVALKHAWTEYQALFGVSHEQNQMLAYCAESFFDTVHRVLLREVILGVSRLSDKPQSNGQRNLPLRSLLSDSHVAADPELSARLSGLVESFEEAAKPFRRHRHKYIAHKDYDVALDQEGRLLERIRKAHVSSTIELAERAIQVYESSVRRTSVDLTVHTLKGARALVRALETSERWKRRVAQRSGEGPSAAP